MNNQDLATNRQKKVLKFFGLEFSPNLSKGAAGFDVQLIFSKPELRDRWDRYVYLTKDYGSDDDELLPFDENELKAVQIPEGWDRREQIKEFNTDVVEGIIESWGPFDTPMPEVEFSGSEFVFTGTFEFGKRTKCQEVTKDRGGICKDTKSVTNSTDFLVIGKLGSKTWSSGSFGNKIENAILLRRQYGKPAIISEQHWADSL